MIKFRPRKIPFRRRLTRASVALIYRQSDSGDIEILFIQRARREGDPWSGDMAFPGGRIQSNDANPRAAAERETLEETGINLARDGVFKTRLSDLITRHHSRWRPMVVTPYVYEWNGSQPETLNHEVEQTVWISGDYLASPENQSTLPFRTPLGTLNLPCCRYQGYCIWGLSYSMLQELLLNSKPD
ncbi:CoA pyrophosphatase [Marinobacter sp. CHS3-4]|uniref:NUDIX hydrolase n=1 Tax=Marinobacter sp. CHS3-4 TaxID=3045174 RepID=UPI0024B5F0CE|nr:CoA pyrophosphatase [Marinobacter sp. CHS3-4]MDI9244671.1 CoA pyrophosphatase [Marinobacter sp. CHS3-4]